MKSKAMMVIRSALAVVVLTVAGCAITEKADTTSTEQVLARNKAQAKRFYAEFISAQDISKAGEFFSPQFTIDDRGNDGVQEEPKDPTEHFGGLFKLISKRFSEFVLTPDEMVAEGNTVAVRWHQTALLRPKEPVEQNPMTKRLNWSGMSFLEFDQKGLIIKARVIQIEDNAEEERVQNQQ